MGQMAQRPERRGRLMDILTDNEIDERTHYFVLLYEADRLRQQIENGDFNFDALSKALREVTYDSWQNAWMRLLTKTLDPTAHL
jgi:hypothetical protein